MLKSSYAVLTMLLETYDGEEASHPPTESVHLEIPSDGSSALHRVSWSIRTRSASCKDRRDDPAGSCRTPLAGYRGKVGLTRTQELSPTTWQSLIRASTHRQSRPGNSFVSAAQERTAILI